MCDTKTLSPSMLEASKKANSYTYDKSKYVVMDVGAWKSSNPPKSSSRTETKQK